VRLEDSRPAEAAKAVLGERFPDPLSDLIVSSVSFQGRQDAAGYNES
jgi:hypothetical protein